MMPSKLCGAMLNLTVVPIDILGDNMKSGRLITRSQSLKLAMIINSAIVCIGIRGRNIVWGCSCKISQQR